jgi:drug/metabolite transporter (DMT)-like permease
VSERARQFLLLAFLNVLWTPVDLAVRSATDAGMSPAAVALARWSLVALTLHLLLRIPAFATYARFKPLMKGDKVRALLIGACLFAPAHALYYFGLTRGASTVGGTVLNATAPIWIGAMAFLFLRERATPHRLFAIALGFAGAWVVVFGFGLPEFGGAGGALFYLLGVLLESIASVIGTRIVRRSSGIGYLSYEVLGMIPTLLLLPTLTGGAMPLAFGTLSLPAILVVAYLVLLPGLVCFGVWYATIERVPLSTMVVTILL